ncbi:unnamed protein product [Moneuplotes crassus]|uniref:SH3 domain-containing protein n=1 Tax=Euplotes crassus TaxID=5936 RepID=A0AAD1Y9R1_EUPCR|nr:unnamed protein product [Moneuplotes crassus]
MSKSRVKSITRSPVCEKSPKVQKFMNKCVKYNQEKYNSKSFVRAKTPNLGRIDELATRRSFSKADKHQKTTRDRKLIRHNQKEETNKHESVKIASPKRTGVKKISQPSRSPNDPSSEKKMHNPFFNNNNEEKKNKRVRIKQPIFDNNQEDEEEEPRPKVKFSLPNKENIDHNTPPTQSKSYDKELEKITKTNLELKDIIQKMAESHLAEKKRMVARFEKETENYFKYYQFFHDNEPKLKQMEKDTAVLISEKKEMKAKITQLQAEANKAKSNSQATKSCCNCEKYGTFCENLKFKLMESLHEIMRDDKSAQSKVSSCQKVVVRALNEVKSFLSAEDTHTRSMSLMQESITAPDIKTYNTDNDDELIRTVEEALLIVRNDSCKRSNFKSQRSLSSLEFNKSPESKFSKGIFSPEFVNINTKSSHNLLQSQLRNSVNGMRDASFRDVINESFGKAIPESPKNKGMEHPEDIMGKKRYTNNNQESQDEELEIGSRQDEKDPSIDQTSDDDTVVDNVINKITNVRSKAKTNQRYKKGIDMNEFEFINENIFTKSNDLYCPISSRDSTLDNIEGENEKKVGFNLPLQIEHKKKPQKEIELAVCLFDFEPQKKSDLGFKAGERIKIVSRSDTTNWWFGSIGSREGYFPKNFIELKKVSK